MDWHPLSTSVHGILKARILERVAISSLRETDTGISNCSISHGCGGGDDDGDKDDSEWHLLCAKHVLFLIILVRVL